MLFVGDFAVQDAPTAQEDAPRHKKAVLCPAEKISALEKFRSGTNYMMC